MQLSVFLEGTVAMDGCKFVLHRPVTSILAITRQRLSAESWVVMQQVLEGSMLICEL